MGEALRFFADRTAWFIEAPHVGEPDSGPDAKASMKDLNSLRNRPAADPASWLPYVKFHSDLDQCEVAMSGDVAISHAAISGATPPSGVTVSVSVGWGVGKADHLLMTHNLGYPPMALVAVGANVLYPGMHVQFDGSGGGRYVTAYVTNTELRLSEWGSAGSATLGATTLSYKVLIIKKPPGATGNKRFELSAAGLKLGLGKFNIDRPYLQVVPGGSPIGLSRGRTIDLNKGAPRMINPDGSVYAPVPTGLATRLTSSPVSAFGAASHYQGSFTGSAALQVQAP